MIPLYETLILVCFAFGLLGFFLLTRWHNSRREHVIAQKGYIIGALFCFIIGASALLAILLLSINPEPSCEWLLSSTNETTTILNETLTAYDYTNSCAASSFGIAETLYSVLVAVFGMALIVMIIVFAFEFVKIIKAVFRRW